MAEIVEETVTSVVDNGTRVTQSRMDKRKTAPETAARLVYFLFGALEIMLVFRLVLRLMGANAGSVFVSFVYGITRVFIMPFEGIFRRGVTEGLETTAVFEPATLIAIVVYSVVAWGVVKLIGILAGEEYTE